MTTRSSCGGEAAGQEVGDAPAVRVLSVSRVAPSLRHGGRVKLHYFDLAWVWLPAVQQLFLFDLGDRDDDGLVSRLKAALADTLTQHLPWAGRLEYEAGTGDIVVDCSDPGVAFIEADAADAMDVRRLAHDEAHDMPAFRSLVPELDARVLPAPVLSVQVTRLGASGLAVGLSMHHAVADGRGMWRFMEAWASSSRQRSTGTPPIYCRDTIHYPRADELAREWLKIIAPNLPVVCSTTETSPLFKMARRTFDLDLDGIRCMKQKIEDLAATASAVGAPKLKPMSTFMALAALVWTAFVRSKGLGAGDDTYLTFLVDLRGRLDPPVTDAYVGNCVRICVVGCVDAAEIAGEAGIFHAARAIQAVVVEMEATPVPHYKEELSQMLRKFPSSRLTNVVGSPWLQGYEGADFGFGKPALSEVVSMNRDGEIMLLGGRRNGVVQLSVSIDPAHMATFMACILSYLPCAS